MDTTALTLSNCPLTTGGVNSDFSPSTINQLVFVMETYHAYCEMETEFV
jgi:hypothetical protein